MRYYLQNMSKNKARASTLDLKWVSTLGLVDQRRKAVQKGNNVERNRLGHMIHRQLKTDKEEWLMRKCDIMETASNRGDARTLFRTIDELSDQNQSRSTTPLIKDKTGFVIRQKEAQLRRWAEHFDELLNRPDPVEEDSDLDVTCQNTCMPDCSINTAPPTEDEIRRAIKNLKTGKAAGPDKVVAEALQAGGDVLIKPLLKLLEVIWRKEEVPQAWKDGIVIPIHKKGEKSDCSNYRGITLLSVAGKILTTIIQWRILQNLEETTDEQQAGFRPGRGCADQIFSLRRIQERRLKHGKPLAIVFVDFSAAFDSIHRPSLWKALKINGIPEKIVNILQNIYFNANSRIRVKGELSPGFSVNTGVRQGCVISPKLFVLLFPRNYYTL